MSHWATDYAALITDSMTQALVVTDGEFTVIHANPEAARLLGAGVASELSGLRLCADGDARSIGFDPDFRRGDDGGPLSGRYTITSPFNEVFEATVSFAGGTSDNPAHLVFLTGNRATTQVDKNFYQSEKLAAMDNIVGGVAHELNNPMTAILGYAELLLATESNPKRKQRIALIAEEADRCAKIIANMLSFTRSFGNEFESANVNVLLEEVVSLRAYQMQVDGVQVNIDIDRNVPLTSVQPSAIRRLFLNILHNAHQALLTVPKEQREFWVSSRMKHGKFSISIMDSGPGIPEELRYRIFDPFFTTRSLGEGMGLGLSVAYGIVHEHHGTIWMEPRDGGGTVFKIELPA